MPRSCAVCGMTLSVVPAWNMQIEITADLQRIDVARHDRLQLVDDLRADQHRVDRRDAAAPRARRGPRSRW